MTVAFSPSLFLNTAVLNFFCCYYLYHGALPWKCLYFNSAVHVFGISKNWAGAWCLFCLPKPLTEL